MTKCDFCIYFSPNSKCFWTFHADREKYCVEAIDRMTETLKNVITVKVEGK